MAGSAPIRTNSLHAFTAPVTHTQNHTEPYRTVTISHRGHLYLIIGDSKGKQVDSTLIYSMNMMFILRITTGQTSKFVCTWITTEVE